MPNRTAQFLHSFHSDLLKRRLDKYSTTDQLERALLKPGESYFLFHDREILEYLIDEQRDRELYPELPWSTGDSMGIAYVWEKVCRPEVQRTQVTRRTDDELL